MQIYTKIAFKKQSKVLMKWGIKENRPFIYKNSFIFPLFRYWLPVKSFVLHCSQLWKGIEEVDKYYFEIKLFLSSSPLKLIFIFTPSQILYHFYVILSKGMFVAMYVCKQVHCNFNKSAMWKEDVGAVPRSASSLWLDPGGCWRCSTWSQMQN